MSKLFSFLLKLWHIICPTSNNDSKNTDKDNKSTVTTSSSTSSNVSTTNVSVALPNSSIYVNETPCFGKWFERIVDAKAFALKENRPLFVFFPSAGCAYSNKWWQNIGATAEFLEYAKNKKIVLMRASTGAFTYVKPHWKGQYMKLGSAPMIFMFKVIKNDTEKTNYSAFYKDECLVLKTLNSFENETDKNCARSFDGGITLFGVYINDKTSNWNPTIMTSIIDNSFPNMTYNDLLGFDN